MGILQFGTYLRQRREALSLKQIDVARAAGISPSYLSRLESGDDTYSNVGRDVLKSLAAVLGEQEDQLDALLYDRPLPRPLQRAAVLPAAIAIVAQGSASSLGGGYVEDYLYLPPDEVRGRILRAIRVTGECMIKDGIEPDDILLIERRSEAYPDGTGVVAVLLDTNEVVIKRLYHKPASGLLELRASDGSPPLMVPTDRVRIEGAILKVTRVRDFKQPPPYRIGW